ncbi:hypothetical protein OF83DRAFT_1166441 [Amylostereum chailletii]|nr:hypothetical protein OF83DRAFT_1166441 [Amylostereum chailletii]
MSERTGMPLLSGSAPPHNSPRADSSCRKCNKEFNIIFTRARRCNHCGYNFCSSCSDFQALMPRAGSGAGYDPVPVCAFCVENLTITAAGRNYLKSLPMSRLKRYVDAYNIKIPGIVEKDDLINTIMTVRESNGCLPKANEDFYRRNSVPNGRSGRPRGLFSSRPPATPPPPPPRHVNPSANFARPDLDPSPRQPRQPSPGRPSPRPQTQPGTSSPRSHPYAPPPTHAPRPQPAYPPPPHPRPATAHTVPSQNANAAPSRSASAAPAVPPQPSAPVPTLDELISMREDAIGSLSIGTLKNVLFQNHVNARLLLEKGELVARVKALVDDERRERAREAEAHAREEEEIVARQHAMMEEERLRQEWVQKQREREQATMDAGNHGAGTDADAGNAFPTPESGSKLSGSPPPHGTPGFGAGSSLERNGLCVICQDEEANIAIVDCGHMAMCRGCSELVMASSRECPLCRTRIITEARLLRIFKT